MSPVTLRGGVAVVGAAVCCAIALAGPAAAETLEGSYTATVTSGFGYLGAPAANWVFTPCGPDCVNVSAQGAVLHRNGPSWTGTFELRAQDNGEVVVCTRSVNLDTLTASDLCPKPMSTMVNYELVRNG